MSSYSLLVEPEDVAQEVELIKLEGKRANRGLVSNKLNRLAYDHMSFDELATPTSEGLEPWETLPFEPNQPEWLKAQERLVEWALDQTQQVQAAINQFLEDPIENYELTLQALIQSDVIHPEAEEGDDDFTPSHQSKVSYVSILKKRVKSRPASKEELIAEMSMYPINRPATTVRQFLRRHKNNLREENGLYKWVA